MDDFLERRHGELHARVVLHQISRAAHDLDLRAEISARFADEIGEILKLITRILSGVAAKDQRHSSADELVTSSVFEMAAVGEVPVASLGPVETREKFAHETRLNRQQ